MRKRNAIEENRKEEQGREYLLFCCDSLYCMHSRACVKETKEVFPRIVCSIPHSSESNKRMTTLSFGGSHSVPRGGGGVANVSSGLVTSFSTHSGANASGLLRSPPPPPQNHSESNMTIATPRDDLEMTTGELAHREAQCLSENLLSNETQQGQVVAALLAEIEKALKEAAFFRAQSAEVQTQVLVLSKDRDDLAQALSKEQSRCEQLARRVEGAECEVSSCSKQMDIKDQQIAALHGELSRLVVELDRTRLDAQRLNRLGGGGNGTALSFTPIAVPPTPSGLSQAVAMQSPQPSYGLR